MKRYIRQLILILQQVYFFKAVITQHPLQDCIFGQDVCPNEHITFWLYKNETQLRPVHINALNPNASEFIPKLPLKIIVHGFTGDRNILPNSKIRPALLSTQEVYVISADYGHLVKRPCYYPWSVRNARIVARCLGQLLDSLIDNRIYESSDIHLIGFSLGGQIVGLAANHVKHRLKRITSLDPAAPGFMTDDLKERIDPSDADFIDVIHTDPFFFSSLPTYGHVDFYPNLESFGQPGCTWFQNGRFRNCNHDRAALYYAESINSKLGFWAYNCASWIEFFLQRCHYSSQPYELMGYWVSENATGSYFLTTNSMSPFAKGPVINIEIEVIDNLKA